jgi:4-amino-4-deoxychorismate lyase
VDRLLRNAARAGVAPPPRLGRAQILRTLLETAAASRRRDGHMRFFLSAGRGGFGLSPAECVASSFYAVVYSKDPAHDPAAPDSEAHLRGWAVKSSPVPPKAPFFAGVKSVGYLPNALAQADAEAEGLETGVFVDAEGYVLEGANANVAALLPDGTLAFVLPPAERGALAGRTAARAMELAAAAAGTGALDGVARVEARRLSVAEARGAREVMLLGSSLPAMPVVRWDGGEIGDGAPGTAALGLRALLLGDRQPAPGGGRHWEVPYGCLTAMGA